VLQKSKLKQDRRNQVDIYNLYKEKEKADQNNKYLRKFLFDLNKEIGRLQSKDDRQKKITDAELKTVNEQKFLNDIEKLLLGVFTISIDDEKIIYI
jgi:vancomycin resistance protein YoaR